MTMREPYRWVCVSIEASSLAATVEDANISSAPRITARAGTGSIIIHLRVFDSPPFDYAAPQRHSNGQLVSGYFTRKATA
jgi:hypothetical protein